MMINQNPSYSLRLAQTEDAEQVWTWRNHPSIQQWMFHQDDISLESHKKWFATQLASPQMTMFIFLIDDAPSGVVNLQQLNHIPVYEWGLYLAPHAPRGTGHIMGKMAIDYAFQRMNVQKIFAQVLSSNQRSYRYHQKLGFTIEGCLRKHHQQHNDWLDIWQFGLLACEYKNGKKS